MVGIVAECPGAQASPPALKGDKLNRVVFLAGEDACVPGQHCYITALPLLFGAAWRPHLLEAAQRFLAGGDACAPEQGLQKGFTVRGSPFDYEAFLKRVYIVIGWFVPSCCR